jgi:NAD(P)-dependent dehydrogenase (short-subunit alcohol dehydrogenase family)
MALMYNPLDLTGKQILVTGASSGIGRATAVTLSQLGARVILTGRREVALQETRAAMVHPTEHLIEPFDLSDSDAIPSWLKGLVVKTGAKLDGVVHSAGISKYTPVRTVNRKVLDEILLPNVYAAMTLLRGFASKDTGADGGSFVMLSSIAGVAGMPGLVAYGGSKGALIAIAQGAAVELKARKIRVNCIAPGYVDTPLLDTARNGLPGTFEQNEQRQFLGIITPEEVAVACGYLLSDAARSITGTTLLIDGGYTA